MIRKNLITNLLFKMRLISKSNVLYNSMTIKIGNVTKSVDHPRNFELVPIKYLSDKINKTNAKHLHWMLQKDNLGQDMFLIGPPGSYKRNLAMSFAELTKREIEYVLLSRDTTEADLKQRREIISGNAIYIDQTALRAATQGRLLILDGIEKAERNVLPILNNLLENREMQLEDGRFLMRAKIYDTLLSKYSKSMLNKWKFVRCNENFRVLALGLPVPKFKGNPLDPPLRSRFQARFIDCNSYEEIINEIEIRFPKINIERIQKIISFIYSIRSDEISDLNLPFFPMDNIIKTLGILENFPEIENSKLIDWLYPYKPLTSESDTKSISNLMKKFQIYDKYNPSTISYLKNNIKVENHSNEYIGSSLNLPFVSTRNIEEMISELLISHSIGDFCIIGPQGCGKSMIVNVLRVKLRANVTHVVLYGDMTAREVLQRRETDIESGDTVWKNSSLVRTAIDGGWAVLEGLNRLERGCLSVLSQLVHDRQLQLFDGSRLLRHDRYDNIKSVQNWTDQDMANRGIYRIHPDFRIIALAEPPLIPGQPSRLNGTNHTEWLTPEVMAIFRFHVLPELSLVDERQIVSHLVPDMPLDKLNHLLDIIHNLRTSEDPQLRDLSHNLSIRQIIRISYRLTQYPTETVSNSIHKACLSKFLPKLVKDSLNQILESCESQHKQNSVEINFDTDHLEKLIKIYTKSLHSNREEIIKGEDEAKVPNIVFFDSLEHTRILIEMLQDFMIGNSYLNKQHLLLVGNQGVGKNKIADRFLQLLNRPREYIQLHRDTTVQRLTLQSSIKDGKLVYEDSALVKAITNGRILVVDEADKASTQVTCILKTLISLGEMELSDGRRIIPDNGDTTYLSKEQQQKILRMHPDFRIIVLANRPGFPFLGNDFFGAMGDIFSCHAVDNPDVASEIKMLQRYGPSVPIETIKKLVFLFSDLRELADKDQINYPYSTREIVNIVRHLEKYPNDALPTVLSNVFDFDLSNKEMLSFLESTLEKHGISLPGSTVKIILANELPLPPPTTIDNWIINFKSLKNLPVINHKKSREIPHEVHSSKIKIETQLTRSRAFMELDECISIHLGNNNVISDMLALDSSHNGKAYISFVTLNPIVLSIIKISKDNEGNCNKLSTCKHASQIDLSDIFPEVQGTFKPLIYLSGLSIKNENFILLFEVTTNKLLQINLESEDVIQISSEECLSEIKLTLRPSWLNMKEEIKNQKSLTRMYQSFSNQSFGSFVVFHKYKNEFFHVINVFDKKWHTVTIGFPVYSLNILSSDQWLITDSLNKLYLIQRNNDVDLKYTIYNIDSNNKPVHITKYFEDSVKLSDLHYDLSKSINSNLVTLGISSDSYVDIFPQLLMENQKPIPIKRVPRPLSVPYISSDSSSNTILPSSGIVVASIDRAPEQLKNTDHIDCTSVSGYLEIINLKSNSLKYIQIPSVFKKAESFQWLKRNIPDIFVSKLKDDVITIDNTGCIHKWTVCTDKLQKELKTWKSYIGAGEDRDRDLIIERLDKDVNTNLSGPKFGEIDPTNSPHVGGNTWAGGSGGRDTAGLGGIGGPFRLDGGHNVFQVSDRIKANVPDHVQSVAREMAQKLWKERLEKIKMSQFDYDIYMRYYKRVESHISAIRSILESLQATAKERQWIRHQTYGDLDDGKLVEGVLGERSIFRCRGEKDPEPGSTQLKPKRFRVICDLSGSMYRFNGHDQRMERQMEAILMIMESFVNIKSEKMIYDIYGHSGEGAQFPFVKLNKPPSNEKQRMDVLSEMLLHSQFCLSGDHTLEAIDYGISELKKTSDSFDQSFLLVLSDANLARYGISPSSVSKLLLREKEIHSFIVFIGSLGDQAQELRKSLPVGHAFVCMDIEALPQILRQIFMTNIL